MFGKCDGVALIPSLDTALIEFAPMKAATVNCEALDSCVTLMHLSPEGTARVTPPGTGRRRAARVEGLSRSLVPEARGL